MRVLPNPFRGASQLEFTASRTGAMEVDVTDVAGRRVRTWRIAAEAGTPVRLLWNGHDEQGRRSRAGVYFWRVRAPGGADPQVRKVVLVE